ncbi:MAG TPA: GxxExxY protein [Phycisphaerales bacterium]|nr:GxxExxY protein [Phycisphaerales bacterium]
MTDQILAAAFKVHSVLGPGLLERLYEEALAYELTKRGIPFERQKRLRVRYEEIEIGDQVVDLLVGGLVIVELKSTEKVSDGHIGVMMSYMRSTGMPLGLLINFNTPSLKSGIYRRVLTSRTPLPRSFLSEETPRNSAHSANSAVAPFSEPHEC